MPLRHVKLYRDAALTQEATSLRDLGDLEIIDGFTGVAKEVTLYAKNGRTGPTDVEIGATHPTVKGEHPEVSVLPKKQTLGAGEVKPFILRLEPNPAVEEPIEGTLTIRETYVV